jgi:hypothetical protein
MLSMISLWGKLGRVYEGKLSSQSLLCLFRWLLFNLIWEDVGAGQKAKSAQKDKRSQYNKSNVHLPPCFLSPLHLSPCLCVSFWSILELLLQWSPWYWGSLWASFLAGSACYSPGQQKKGSWVVIGTRWVSLESSDIFPFLFIVVWLALERNWLNLFWDPKLHLQLLLPSSSTWEITHQLPLLSLWTSCHHSIFLFCLLHPILHLILTCLC